MGKLYILKKLHPHECFLASKSLASRVVQKTPTLETESRSSSFPWFQTRWVRWCTKNLISSTFRGREFNFKFLKMDERLKNQKAKILSNTCLEYAKWWEDSKFGLRIQIGQDLTHFFLQKQTAENWQNARSRPFWHFFGQKRGQMLSDLNPETRFGMDKFHVVGFLAEN